MSQPTFGIRLPVTSRLADPNAIAKVARLAEELGFDTVWVHDYIIWTKELDRTHISCGAAELIDEHHPPNFFESLTTLAYVAGMTSTVRLGTAVLCVPYREPIVTAKQIANIDVLSGGRLALGVGVGAPKRTGNVDFEVLGISRATKYRRTREYLEAMIRIWTEDRPAYEGEYAAFPQADIYPKPTQKPYPPIWVGGAGEKAIEMVVDIGQGWLPSWFTPTRFRERVAGLHELLGARGRDPDEVLIGSEVVACIAPTAEEAHAASAATVATLSAGFTVETKQGAEEASLIGSPDVVAGLVAGFVDAGVDHFELKFVYSSLNHLLEQMEMFSREVASDYVG